MKLEGDIGGGSLYYIYIYIWGLKPGLCDIVSCAWIITCRHCISLTASPNPSLNYGTKDRLVIIAVMLMRNSFKYYAVSSMFRIILTAKNQITNNTEK